jgi:hypothetical protein
MTKRLITAILLLAGICSASTTVNLSGTGRFKAFDPDTGALLVGGKLQSYVCGTTTPTSTYADSTGVVANSNPVILDGSGEASVWLDPSVCLKLVLKDSSDSVIWTLDNINTPAAGVFTTLSATGAVSLSSTLSGTQFTSTIATGSQPIVVASTTKVTNFNADQVDGGDWADPGAALGTGTRVPSTSFFTNLDISGTTSFGGSATLATGKVFTATDADSITVAGRPLPTTYTVPFYEFGTEVDTHMWIAPRAGEVVSIKEIHSVVGGGSCAVRPRKITDTSAPGAVASSTVKEITTAAFDCTATINTTQTGSLSATQSDYQFAAGDKISLDISGTQTGLVGIIVLEWKAR